MEGPCPFCVIAGGEDSSVEVLAETSEWIAFFPDDPAAPGHTLVIPRTHVPDIWQATDSLAGSLMGGVIIVGRAIQQALRPDGMNLVSSAGEAAEQTVFHLHLHLLPRWWGDGFPDIWPHKRTLTVAELSDAAQRIRCALPGDEIWPT